jgi:acetoacetyl-CoA reductase
MTKRLAVLTGGTTGIGAAICKALRGAGYGVVANYIVHNDEAKAFEKETGAKAYKWDVTDFAACETLPINGGQYMES